MPRAYDPDFYRAVHELLSGEQLASGANRRRRERRPFPVLQRMAPYSGGPFPSEAAFQTIVCHDLSETGCSFTVPAELVQDQLVIALGGGDETLYLLAQVVRQSSSDSAPGPEGVRVGCRFVGRLPFVRTAIVDAHSGA